MTWLLDDDGIVERKSATGGESVTFSIDVSFGIGRERSNRAAINAARVIAEGSSTARHRLNLDVTFKAA